MAIEKKTRKKTKATSEHEHLKEKLTPENIRERLLSHIKYTAYKDWRTSTDYDKLVSLSYVVRDLIAESMIRTQRAYLEKDVKRLYYLSMEFLIGQLLRYNLHALGIYEETKMALEPLGLDIERLCDQETDAGLGNGGLGRLAACFLESMASMGMPGYGYGLRYEHGMFKQEFHDGWQIEKPDDWLKYGTPWEVVRPEYTIPVLLYGKVEKIKDNNGIEKDVWLDWQMIEGVPHDIAIVGFGNNTANILRLWASRASEGFRIDVFNRGEYVKAVESENWAETITKVLYPSDSIYAGKELRLIQEYFLVTCAIRDIMRRYLKNHSDLTDFHRLNAIQLNDTHPALSVAELMRYFLDESNLPWEKAWDITVKTFGYTNHTLLPEALERWPVELLQRVLPRHMQIIYEINYRFLQKVELRFPGDISKLRSMSLIEEGEHQQVRMANLAIVGSHSVNGVSKLHSELIKTRLVPDFFAMQPEKFNNKTNGINHRRWLLQCNPGLASLISKKIGEGWIKNLDALREIEKFADNEEFRRRFMSIKRENKKRLAQIIKKLTGIEVRPDSIFDVQVKRLHEYKRQFLNVLHIVTAYNRILKNPGKHVVPRTFIFGAKAAPSYHIAKRIIKLINTIAEKINSDPIVEDRLKVVFIPDYRVSLAEYIMPAADLSEQISTAGTEASGTGNMKLALNGALTIGTWDGANIEIAEEVGLDNIFIFGHRAEELDEIRRKGYDVRRWLNSDRELLEAVEAIRSNIFDPRQPELFHDLISHIFDSGDQYFHFADFRSYVDTQAKVSELYLDKERWAHKAILNVARIGKFSSDRTIREYADEIWKIEPLHMNRNF